jgi:hypothetical protein
MKARTEFLAACREAGTAAGTWYEIGTEDAARWVLAGIRDGDPEVLDTFPTPGWGGEWAGEPTYGELAAEYCVDPDEADSIYGEALAAFDEGCGDEIERAAVVMVTA